MQGTLLTIDWLLRLRRSMGPVDHTGATVWNQKPNFVIDVVGHLLEVEFDGDSGILRQDCR